MGFTFKDFLDLIVPHYLIIAISAPFASYMILTGQFPSVSILPVIFSLSLAVCGFNITNMVFDAKIDAIDKPLRPIVQKKISVSQAKSIAIIFYFFSILIAFFINNYFLFLIAIFIIMTYCYSAPKIYLKKYFWASSFVGAVAYGIIPFLAAHSITTSPINLHFLVFFTLIYVVISNAKDFEDMTGEKKLGINSLPLIFGPDLAAKLMIASELFLFLLTGYSAITGIVEFKFVYASTIALILFIPLSWLFWKDVQRLKFKKMAFEHFNDKKIKQIITQSDAVTYSILLSISSQLIFGFVAVAIL